MTRFLFIITLLSLLSFACITVAPEGGQQSQGMIEQATPTQQATPIPPPKVYVETGSATGYRETVDPVRGFQFEYQNHNNAPFTVTFYNEDGSINGKVISCQTVCQGSEFYQFGTSLGGGLLIYKIETDGKYTLKFHDL